LYLWKSLISKAFATDTILARDNTSRPRKPDDGDNQMNEKDDDITHPGMLSKPEKTPNFDPIQ
jgi:hypothetical protein